MRNSGAERHPPGQDAVGRGGAWPEVGYTVRRCCTIMASLPVHPFLYLVSRATRPVESITATPPPSLPCGGAGGGAKQGNSPPGSQIQPSERHPILISDKAHQFDSRRFSPRDSDPDPRPDPAVPDPKPPSALPRPAPPRDSEAGLGRIPATSRQATPRRSTPRHAAPEHPR